MVSRSDVIFLTEQSAFNQGQLNNGRKAIEESSVNERKEIFKQNLRMILVFILCAATASSGAFYLFTDMDEGSGAGRGEAMARLEQKESKVRRKPSNSFSWSNVHIEQPLYKKDSIHTGPESTAVVRMKEGQSIEIGENSLVVIDRVDQLTMNPIKGSFVIRSKEGDQKVNVGADGKTHVEALPAHLVAPAPFAVLFSRDLKEENEVYFQWEIKAPSSTEGDREISLEVSRDKNFKNIVKSEKLLASNAAPVSMKLPSGAYYWRLSQNGKSLAESNRFSIKGAPELTPLDPPQDAKIALFAQNPVFQFKWNIPAGREQQDDLRREGVEHYLEVSEGNDFKSPTISKPVDAASGITRIDNISFGTQFWRLRSVYGKSKNQKIEVVSPVTKFDVERAQAVIASVVLPKDGATKELTPQVSFRWEVESSSTDFEYQLVLGTQDGKPIATQKLNAPQWTWKTPAVGKYAWQVKVLYQGKPVGESPLSKFSVYTGAPLALKSPEKNEDHYYWKTPEHFDFEWKKDDLVKNENATYELQVSGDISFKEIAASIPNLKEEEVSSEKIKVDSGVYYWRVRLVDQTGSPIKTSEARKVSFGLHPRLAGPEGSQPVSGYTKTLSEDEKDLYFSWEALKHAKSFEWVLMDSSSIKRTPAMLSENKIQAKIIAAKKLDAPKFSMNFDEFKNIPPGKYAWTVRAIDPLGRAGEWMPLREIIIDEGELLSAPDVLSPEVQ